MLAGIHPYASLAPGHTYCAGKQKQQDVKSNNIILSSAAELFFKAEMIIQQYNPLTGPIMVFFWHLETVTNAALTTIRSAFVMVLHTKIAAIQGDRLTLYAN